MLLLLPCRIFFKKISWFLKKAAECTAGFKNRPLLLHSSVLPMAAENKFGTAGFDKSPAVLRQLSNVLLCGAQQDINIQLDKNGNAG
jgi:hypothetical protein